MKKIFINKGRLVNAIKRAPFTLAAACAWTASAGFNALTGASMGGDYPLQTAIWLAAAVSLDMLKAGGAIRFSAALAHRHWGMAATAAGLMIIGTTVSLLSALTMRANVAAGDNAERQKIIEARASIKREIKNARADMVAVMYARTIAEVESYIQKAHRHKRWRTSEQCSNATVPPSISFCNRYSSLSAEKTATATRINLNRAIIAANKRLAALPMPKASTSPVADAVGTILASAGIKADPAKVADWIMIFLTIAIEFGAVAGPALAFGTSREMRPTAAQKCRPGLPTRREIGWIEDLKRAAASPSFARLTYNEDGTISTTYRCTARAWNVGSIATVKSWLEKLESQGYIERLSSSRGQTIRILRTA